MGVLASIRNTAAKALGFSAVSSARGGWYRIFESYAGAWQQNVTVDRNLVLSYNAAWACMTRISGDISQMRPMLIDRRANDICVEVSNPAFSPVLTRPNKFQHRIQFWENWILSKLIHGNTYVLKQRDNRNVVVGLYILDPLRVTPLVTEIGDIYYQCQSDNITGLTSSVTVPASEMIHDRWNCLFHPLIGMSPIYAAAVPATQGLNIQGNSAQFFGNQSRPGGILTAPGAIADETAERLKETWDTKFSGENTGKVAVLGDGLTFQPIGASAVDSQLVEQLKWTAQTVCSCFHVPAWKVGVTEIPRDTNVQSLNVIYFTDALQKLIEDAEICLREGLGMKALEIKFNTDSLLRMDSLAQMEVLDKSKGILKIDELRARINYGGVPGGDTIYLQQQDHSLEAIAARDQQIIDGPPEPQEAPEPELPEQARNALLRLSVEKNVEAWLCAKQM